MLEGSGTLRTWLKDRVSLSRHNWGENADMSNVKVDKIPLAESRRVSWLGSTSMSKVTASKIFKTQNEWTPIGVIDEKN
jgi:hypothetical protein